MSLPQWVSTSNAAKALGLSPVTLLRKRATLTKDGYFQSGVHYLKSGEARNCPFLWNLKAIEEVFANWKSPRREDET